MHMQDSRALREALLSTSTDSEQVDSRWLPPVLCQIQILPVDCRAEGSSTSSIAYTWSLRAGWLVLGRVGFRVFLTLSVHAEILLRMWRVGVGGFLASPCSTLSACLSPPLMRAFSSRLCPEEVLRRGSMSRSEIHFKISLIDSTVSMANSGNGRVYRLSLCK